MKNWIKKNWIPFALILSVFVFVTICSMSSFLYRTNDWVDVHCFYTVAKAMNNNQVLYRDIYEQKGPYLYFLHLIMYWISDSTYFGSYVIELIAGAILAVAIYKIFELYIQNKTRCFVYTTVFLFAYYAPNSFGKGDSVEELLMPMMAFSIYFLLHYIEKKKEWSFVEPALIGVFFSIALLSKFTLAPFYAFVGLLYVVLLIKEKKVASIFKCAGFAILGILIGCIPCIIYCSVTNSFYDLYVVYFYNNLFVYGSVNDGVLVTLIKFFLAYVESFAFGWTYSILTVIGFIYLIIKRKENTQLLVFISILYVLNVLSIFIGGRSYAYYGLPLSIFAVFGCLGIDTYVNYLLAKKNKTIRPKIFAPIFSAVLLILTFACNADTYQMFQKESNYPVFQMREIICKEDNPTLLNYGFLDLGLYFECDVTPTCKYFCGFNIELDELKETQEVFIKEGKVMFVVTRDEELPAFGNKYELVFTTSTVYEYELRTYHLYKLKA